MKADIRLRVVPQRLIETAKQWQQEIQMMEEELIAIREIISRTAGYWQGSGAENCRKDFTAKLEQVAELLAQMDQRPAELITMTAVYHRSEAANLSEAEGLANSIW